MYLSLNNPRFHNRRRKLIARKMAIKLFVVVLAALTVVSASSEKQKRHAEGPDFVDYFNKFQEQMKPITSQFPSLPNGFGSFPSLPGMGGGSSGSSTGGSQYKRQVSPNTISEWFNKFQETGNNFSGNLPFKPPFGQFPFPGSSSHGSSESSGNENS